MYIAYRRAEMMEIIAILHATRRETTAQHPDVIVISAGEVVLRARVRMLRRLRIPFAWYTGSAARL
jgi:hypothetical protein